MQKINEMKLETYKMFYQQGIWNDKILEDLVKIGTITEQEKTIIKLKPKTYADDDRIQPIIPTYELWDKRSPINGVPAEDIINQQGLQYAKQIVLIKFGDVVREVSDLETIKINNNITLDTPDNEAAELYALKIQEDMTRPQINLDVVKAGIELYNNEMDKANITQIIGLLIEIRDLLKPKK